MLLKLVASENQGVKPTYKSLADSLGMSASEAHASVQRCARAGLCRLEPRSTNRKALLEFLLHGLKYAFWPERGAITRGFPTAHAAPPLSGKFGSVEMPPVWPDPSGPVRGECFRPLHKSATRVAKDDPATYALLALADAVRGGRARERQLAEEELRARLGP